MSLVRTEPENAICGCPFFVVKDHRPRLVNHTYACLAKQSKTKEDKR